MVSKLQKDNKGFTIIEVLIVLAIAGLIMLIVFLAIPALQRTQRNSSRNSDGSRISAAISECMANRNGATGVTATGCGTASNINQGNMSQLTTFGNAQTSIANMNNGTATNEARYMFNATCQDGALAVAGTSNRQFAVTYRLETASGTIPRCIGSEGN